MPKYLLQPIISVKDVMHYSDASKIFCQNWIEL